MLLPDFTEEKERETVMYFRVGNKDPNRLLQEIESVYACFSSAGITERDGETYAAVAVETEE